MNDENTDTQHQSDLTPALRKQASARRTYYRRKARDQGLPVPVNFDERGYPLGDGVATSKSSMGPMEKIARARAILCELEKMYKDLMAMFAVA